MTGLPEASRRHYRAVQRLQGRAVRSALLAWDQVAPAALTASWRTHLPALEQAIAVVQLDAAIAGSSYTAASLAELGDWVAPDAFVDPGAFVGYSASGASLEAALYSPVPHAKRLLADGMPLPQARGAARKYLAQVVSTQVADVARQAASIDVAARPGVGYVRMVGPAACDRCVVLAGRFYRWNTGFRRHPRCHCVHVPARAKATAAAAAEGLISDPYEHFRALPAPEQDRIYGKAGAQAIRDGADIFQVVNARRGAAGLTTTEGTSRRGLARALAGRRLTPDGIYRTARSRPEALRLLAEHGYVLPGGQLPDGTIRGAFFEGFGALGRGGTRVGARAQVLRAQATGIRNGSRYTMTEAERRLDDARGRYEQVLAGVNPYSRSGAGLTPELASRAEADFRRWLSTGGQVFAA